MATDIRRARLKAATKYKPAKTRVLFIAESPPQASERYFYFANVKGHDALWVGLMKALYKSEWGETKKERKRKPYWLAKFQNCGFQLIDAVKEPLGGKHDSRVLRIKAEVTALISKIREIAPHEGIVLIKKSVHQVLFRQLKDAGCSVINKTMLPFPARHQKRFIKEVRRLIKSGSLQITALRLG